jgi:uracil-DNA glycosylase family 4
MAASNERDHSPEYLKAVMEKAKQLLPKWMYEKVHQLAMPLSGGRARWRKPDQPAAPDPDTVTLDVTKAADLPLAPPEHAWDAQAAEQRVRAWAAGDMAKYAQAFLLANPTRKEALEGYKLPFADVIGGTLTAVTKGLEAALEAVKQAELPAEVQQACAAVATAYQAKANQVAKTVQVPSAGPEGALVAFVGACPSQIDGIRGEPLTGPAGALFNEEYLAPLGLTRKEVFVTNLVPNVLKADNGASREPTKDEAAPWGEWLVAELRKAQPAIVVALGQVAKEALGTTADFVLPHPMAVLKHGDSGEVARKCKQIRRAIELVQAAER